MVLMLFLRSLGAVLVEILTGAPPYTGTGHEAFLRAAQAEAGTGDGVLWGQVGHLFITSSAGAGSCKQTIR